MDSKNTTIQQPVIPLEHDCQNCRMRMVGDTNLVTCLMEAIICQWALPFGDARYCKHPSAKQFAISKM